MMKVPELSFERCVSIVSGELGKLSVPYTIYTSEEVDRVEFHVSYWLSSLGRIIIQGKDDTVRVSFELQIGESWSLLDAFSPPREWTPAEQALADQANDIFRGVRCALENAHGDVVIKRRKRPSAPAPSAGQGEETEGDPLPSPRPETLRKVAMVRKVIAAWDVSKTRACKCVGIRVDTYTQYNDRPGFEERIQKEIALLENNNFGSFLSGIAPPDRGTATGLYDDFWATA